MFTKMATLGLLAVALSVGFSTAAQAGQPPHHHHHGHTHDGYGIPRGPHGIPHGGYGPYHSGYHNNTHLDWHPGGLVPHRNHYHYVPAITMSIARDMGTGNSR